jgi:hypothetical protein
MLFKSSMKASYKRRKEKGVDHRVINLFLSSARHELSAVVA